MTIAEIISQIDQQNKEATIYAKKMNGEFLPSSQAVLIEISDDDVELQTSIISEKFCPGFDYFMEVFLVQELLEDLEGSDKYLTIEQKVEGIIHYAKFDCF